MLFAAVAIAVLFCSVDAHAQLKRDDVRGYEFVQFTDNDRSDSYPRVSSEGLMVWVATYHLPGAQSANDQDAEIFFWDGVSITQVTDNDVSDERAVVNNHAEMAWQRFGIQSEAEIFATVNGTTIQITNDPEGAADRYPDINDRGVVVWGRRVDERWWVAVFDPAAGAEFSTPGLLGYRPHINNADRFIGSSIGITGMDGRIVQSIPSPESLGYSHYRRWEINDLDQLALEADPGPENPWWPDRMGRRDILFWDGSRMRTLYRSPGPWVGRADLNNQGVVAFEGFGGLATSVSRQNDTEIFIYDPRIGTVIQLTDDNEDDLWPTVTEDGRIVWHGTGNYPGASGGARDREIFMAVPTGDYDGDGIRDVDDNCPTVINGSQLDRDGDQTGDACDNCRKVADPRVPLDLGDRSTTGSQLDDDLDGVGNACDGDFTEAAGDGFVNGIDLLKFLQAFGKRVSDPDCPGDSDDNSGPCARYDLTGEGEFIGVSDLLRMIGAEIFGRSVAEQGCTPADDGLVHCPLP